MENLVGDIYTHINDEVKPSFNIKVDLWGELNDSNVSVYENTYEMRKKVLKGQYDPAHINLSIETKEIKSETLRYDRIIEKWVVVDD